MAELAVKHCSVDGCPRPYHGAGLCAVHYARRKRTGTPGGLELRRPATYDGQTCAADGCDQPAHKRGYCNSHYMKKRRSGELA